ncbi:Forkhead-associated domain-containing protein 1 [Trichoplax sp. H2]|nr:Forkhead-associated domain-containing protein 1 [Trichoplax sp. H2]|eukprot:RDD42410.1 Forkhead-associated domain-containing protein 1 [Trichoplax sp. H2]
MKGYLKSSDGLFLLDPRFTTIGRDNCDLLLQSPNLERRHAIIEYHDSDGHYYLRDLNTANGTYVNDKVIQNGYIQLAPGDILRFDFDGIAFQFDTDETLTHLALAGNRQQTLVTEQSPKAIHPMNLGANFTATAHLPQIHSSSVVKQQRSGSLPGSRTQPTNLVPRPPSRPRPSSGSSHRYSDVGITPPLNSTYTQSVFNQAKNGWIGSAGSNSFHGSNDSLNSISRNDDVGDARNKDSIISSLRRQVGDLKHQIELKNQSIIDVNDKLIAYEGQLESTATAVDHLKSEIMRPQQRENIANESAFITSSQQQLQPHTLNFDKLKKEMQYYRYSLHDSAQNVSKLRQEIDSKNGIIADLKEEVSRVINELNEREVTIAAVNAKLARLNENAEFEASLEKERQEYNSMKQKYKSNVKELNEITEKFHLKSEEVKRLNTLIIELEQVKDEHEAKKLEFSGAQEEAKHAKLQYSIAQTKHERLRKHLLHELFADGQRPSQNMNDCSDDEIIQLLSQLRKQNIDKEQTIDYISSKNEALKSQVDNFIIDSKMLQEYFKRSTDQILDAQFSIATLKQEQSKLNELELSEDINWIKESTNNLLQGQIIWCEAMEVALTDAGFDVHNGHNPCEAIADLSSKLQQESNQSKFFRDRCKTVQEENEIAMQSAINTTKQQCQEELETLVAKLKEDHNKELSGLKETYVKESQEKLEQQSRSDLEKYNQLNVDYQKDLNDMELIKGQLDLKSTEISQLNDEKVKLEEQLVSNQNEHQKNLDHVQQELNEAKLNYENDISKYREETRQHALTIVAMEDKLITAINENVQLKDQIVELKQQIITQREVPVIPRSPSPTIPQIQSDIDKLEELVTILRRELLEAKKEIQVRDDMISTLNKDLAGASAKLTDMTGELNEQQKLELQHHRQRLTEVNNELQQQKDQILKMSELVDRQQKEMEKDKADLKRCYKVINQLKNRTSSIKEETIANNDQHSSEKEHLEKQLQEYMKKARTNLISSLSDSDEFVKLGMKCQEEGHKDVIAKQTESLSYMRQKLNLVEEDLPYRSDREEAMFQLSQMKKELSNIKAFQKSTSTMNKLVSKANASGTDKGKKKQNNSNMRGRGGSNKGDPLAASTIESLELSEKSYFSLLRAIQMVLRVNDVPGTASFTSVTLDEKSQLLNERHEAAEMLSSQIRVLQKKIENKDKLLAGYEDDLQKLRNYEETNERRTADIKLLEKTIRESEQENKCLKESVRKFREQIDEQDRLNQSLLGRKAFYSERKVADYAKPKQPKIPDEITDFKAKTKKKVKDRKLKRKDYEITTLKKELKDADKRLNETAAKLLVMEREDKFTQNSINANSEQSEHSDY